MSDQLTVVGGRVPHRFQAEYADVDAVRQAISSVRQAMDAAYYEANPNADAEMRAAIEEELTPIRHALDDPALVDAYVGVVPCVETFVATELDATTPGRRGLGRSVDSPPRLGGAFREQLANDEARADFGRLIERAILETYCGTAAGLQAFYDPPTFPRARPASEVFELWVSAMYVGTRGLGDRTIEVIGAAQATTEVSLLATGERHGLLAGLRRGKRERELVSCAAFWTAAGAALYWVPAQR